MAEKTIKTVVDEFKSAFGPVEFIATNHATGQVGCSRNYQASPPPVHEIDAGDYLAMGGDKHYDMNEGALEGLLALKFKKVKPKETS